MYEVRDGRPHHLAQTEAVPCELGSAFGAELVIHFGHHKGGALPVQGEWRKPPVPGVREAIQRFSETQPMVDEEETQVPLAAGATLGTPEDLVAGDYVLRFLDPETEHVYYECRFRVDECP